MNNVCVYVSCEVCVKEGGMKGVGDFVFSKTTINHCQNTLFVKDFWFLVSDSTVWETSTA